MPPRLTKDDFIRRATAVHGAKFDYSCVAYETQFVPVTIRCLECQTQFQQKPHTHFQGHGCSRCAKSLSPEDFMTKARAVHGDAYVYGTYTSMRDKIDLVCRKCETRFSQTASNHLRGKGGCPSCSVTRQRLTTADFVNLARAVHGEAFNYDSVKYVTSHIDVIIHCNTCCEDFPQSPNTHLTGSGCQTCGYRAMAEAHRSSTEDFIAAAKKVHGNKYDYSKVQYVGSTIKVEIVCKRHGAFLMTPNAHLVGQDCRLCSRSGVSKAEIAWLDSLAIPQQQRQVRLPELSIRVDGYDPVTRTVYEFLGDFWHGNPAVYAASSVNTVSKKTFGTLYIKTLARFARLTDAGYKVVWIWERDWRQKMLQPPFNARSSSTSAAISFRAFASS